MRSGALGPDHLRDGGRVKILLPRLPNGTTPVNVAGVAVARYAPNRAGAVAFVEYLLSPRAQTIIADAANEYPVRKGAGPTPSSPRPAPSCSIPPHGRRPIAIDRPRSGCPGPDAGTGGYSDQ